MNKSETVVREVFRLLEDGDADAAVELMDPEIEWRNTGLPTFRGTRVHEMFKGMIDRGFDFTVEMHHVAASGNVVLTDRTDILEYGRWSTAFWVRGTFEVRNGKIVLWDDAFSWGDFVSASLIGLARAITPR